MPAAWRPAPLPADSASMRPRAIGKAVLFDIERWPAPACRYWYRLGWRACCCYGPSATRAAVPTPQPRSSSRRRCGQRRRRRAGRYRARRESRGAACDTVSCRPKRHRASAFGVLQSLFGWSRDIAPEWPVLPIFTCAKVAGSTRFAQQTANEDNNGGVSSDANDRGAARQCNRAPAEGDETPIWPRSMR